MKKLDTTDYPSLLKELSSIPLDTNESVLFLSQKEFLSMLHRFRNGLLTAVDLERIADLLECKDGILFENNHMKEYIHLISNIDISGLDMMTLIERIILENK